MGKNGIRYFRKIRQLTYGNRTGDAFGISIPRHIATQFFDTNLHVKISGSNIILESGAECNKGGMANE